MCCLFGFLNYSGQRINGLEKLTNCLARQATARGTDATGISYNHDGKLIIHKEPKSAFKMEFKHPENVVCVMAHTRHSTQGSEKKNYNNHPFLGRCVNRNFALAHNGVLMNEKELKKRHHLPKTKIETDSYVAVQLIEKKKKLSVETVKFMAEATEGSFAYSILDNFNTLWLVRGDSPLTLLHIPKYKLYVYASTQEILYKALVDTNIFEEIKKGKCEEIKVSSGDIIRILSDSTVLTDKFNYFDYSYLRCNWWDRTVTIDDSADYVDNLKMVAGYYGYNEEEIDELLLDGFTPDEIEEYLCCRW